MGQAANSFFRIVAITSSINIYIINVYELLMKAFIPEDLLNGDIHDRDVPIV